MKNVKVSTGKLSRLVWYAGELVRRQQNRALSGKVLAERYKDDDTPVTSLDETINRVFSEFARKQNIGFIGEEGNGSTDHEVVLFVDPIDGTGAFMRNMNTATVIATLMHMDGNVGAPIFSIIHEPLSGVEGVSWIGQSNKPTRLLRYEIDDKLPNLSDTVPSRIRSNICVFKGASHNLAAVKARIETDEEFSNQEMGSFGISGGLIASGIIHAAAIAATSAVESAAMSLIVRGSGGVALDLTGKPLRSFDLGTIRGKVDFTLPNGSLFASNMSVANKVLEHVQAVQ